MIAGDPQRDGDQEGDQEVRAERIEKGRKTQKWAQKEAGGYSKETSYEKLREAKDKGQQRTPIAEAVAARRDCSEPGR